MWERENAFMIPKRIERPLTKSQRRHQFYYCNMPLSHIIICCWVDMWVYVFIASSCTPIYFTYHLHCCCHFDIERDYSYFYLIFQTYMNETAHIYASDAMRNIYCHLSPRFISDDKTLRRMGRGQFFSRMLNIIAAVFLAYFTLQKDEKKYWICMLNAKNSLLFSGFLPFLWFVISMSFALCRCFVPVLLPSSLSLSYLEIIKIIENIFHHWNCCRFEYFWLSSESFYLNISAASASHENWTANKRESGGRGRIINWYLLPLALYYYLFNPFKALKLRED